MYSTKIKNKPFIAQKNSIQISKYVHSYPKIVHAKLSYQKYRNTQNFVYLGD